MTGQRPDLRLKRQVFKAVDVVIEFGRELHGHGRRLGDAGPPQGGDDALAPGVIGGQQRIAPPARMLAHEKQAKNVKGDPLRAGDIPLSQGGVGQLAGGKSVKQASGEGGEQGS